MRVCGRVRARLQVCVHVCVCVWSVLHLNVLLDPLCHHTRKKYRKKVLTRIAFHLYKCVCVSVFYIHMYAHTNT